jgi:hypothetical protein
MIVPPRGEVASKAAWTAEQPQPEHSKTDNSAVLTLSAQVLGDQASVRGEVVVEEEAVPAAGEVDATVERRRLTRVRLSLDTEAVRRAIRSQYLCCLIGRTVIDDDDVIGVG